MSKWKIILNSLISIVFSYYIAVLLHEYGHATMAWIFGYKKSPFDIMYGSWCLLPVSENVKYESIMSLGHGTQAALIGISGISVTTLLFLISLFFLSRRFVLKKPFLLIFFFWLAVINLMEMFSYVPNRTFTGGDITEFAEGLRISPLWIFIPGTLLVCLALFRFYRFEIIKMYALSSNNNLWIKRLLLYLTFWPQILEVVYWTPPTEYIILSYSANIFSILVILFIIVACDPSKNWVEQKIMKYKRKLSYGS